ncbi:Na+/H+ antiporter NhaA [Prevotella histicola]|uniref:Na(+)/H(+) antiporter NhaA n=1 Tax=Prevotella histicola JCM 15637 = DNF00424 TaxID=1236504 RepID=A0AAW3FG85_9BACT|nr:Na+/H+ antiporter NhaA [Prevotella histicola]KGF26815.1 Na(+)/H(+) antiporter NhaA [Prevotella histicola JCM 15637 = DNF00424]MBF1409090.1 Na+/H+ antiporter NhaA [Prevotella histicola]
MRQRVEKKLNQHLMLPIKLFMGREKSGGIVLILSVTLAMILANSNLAESYSHFFEQEVGFIVNGEPYLNYSLHHWINDGLMAMFFFVVGLELKREFIGGELADIRNTILPIGAAIGGMIVPALIFLSLNIGTPQTMGWGIPMATDIAFALGVVYLLGDKVPVSAKVFLTTLAIVDDLGAVLVIAFFYTSELSIASLLFGLGFLAVMFIGNRLGIKSLFFYAALGIGGVWVTFLLSGIHATIAAVLAAFMIPADAKINESVYLKRIKKLTRRFEKEEANEVRTLEEGQVDVLTHIQHDTTIAIPLLQQLEHKMTPIVTFFIMPIFAIANAGISFTDLSLSDIFSTHVALGVTLGLLLGKPIGIIGATFLMVKMRWATLPSAITRRTLLGLGMLASIGFTMSMFISTLAFTDELLMTQAKLGIFLASILGGIGGYVLLNKKSK